MSYTYLLEQGEESSAGCLSDIPQSVLSNLNLTAEKSYSKDNETASCPSFQSGTMSAHLTELRGEEKLMSSAEDSHAQTYLLVEESGNISPETLQVPEVVYGGKWRESSVKYCLNSCSWKTHQHLWQEDLPWFSVTLPVWGMMQDGGVLEQTPPRCHITAPDSGWLPTPVASMWKGTTRSRFKKSRDYRGTNLAEGLRRSESDPQRASVFITELVMGFPIMWSALNHLEMHKFQSWQQQHSKFWEENK